MLQQYRKHRGVVASAGTRAGASFADLPDEIVVLVLSKVVDVLHVCRQVCRKWNTLADDRMIFDRKLTIAVSVVGATGVGKTSLIGQVLVQNKEVDERAAAVARATAVELKRESMRLAVLVDKQKEELERGFTIDTRRRQVEGTGYMLDLISVPGNLRYFKNLATGISQGDAALLVVDVREAEYMRTEKGVRQMVEMLKIVGTSRFVVAVNKMDLVGYSQAAFESAVERVRALFQAVRVSWTGVVCVPVAAMENVNIWGYAGRDIEWYTGPTLFGALDRLTPPARPLHKPLRITIDKVYTVKGVGTVACGTVIQGVVRVEQPVKIAPKGVVSEIRSMHLAIRQQAVELAYPGEYIGMCLRGVKKADCGARKLGTITGYLPKLDEETEPTPVRNVNAWQPYASMPYSRGDLRRMMRQKALYAASGFTAQLAIWKPQGKISIGTSFVMHIHNAQIAARLVEVTDVVKASEKRAGDRGGYNTPAIYRGEIVVARLSVDGAALERADDCGKLGRFILRNEFTVVGGGIITDVEIRPERQHLTKK